MPTLQPPLAPPPSEAPVVPLGSPPPAPELAKKTPEAWALERFGVPDTARGAAPGSKKLEGTPLLLLAGAKHLHHWVEGDLVTEADFDAGWVAYATQPTGR